MDFRQVATLISLLFQIGPSLLNLIFKHELSHHPGHIKKNLVMNDVQELLLNYPGIDSWAKKHNIPVEQIISFLIDLLILILNHFYGKDWANHIYLKLPDKA